MDWNGGDRDGYFFEPNDVPKFYASYGYTAPATNHQDADVMYYWGYHAAIRKHCGCGWGKWIMYESKCGTAERIEHVWNQLDDSGYGYSVLFYKRP